MFKNIIIYLILNFRFIQVRKQHLTIREKNRWKKAFFNFLRSVGKNSTDYLGRWNVVEGFAQSDIRLIKRIKYTGNTEIPIVICVLLNEIERLPIFLEHYRGIGIKRFAMIDNNSTDGTVDYLKRQRDVELFQTKDTFETKIKMGWINRVISYYGTSNWYLVVDTDELLVWENVENTNIQSVIHQLNRENIMRARALMIDMYPKEITWDTDESFKEIYSSCMYFDCNTYIHKNSDELYLISGGPRERKLGMTVWLTKYPLFCLKRNEILCNPHAIYPYEKKKARCYLALLHYKFLTRDDQRKLRKYARKGNYVHNSAEYRLYLKKYQENADNFNFYYDGSVEYTSSSSLKQVKEIDKMYI